ncbi:MAG: amino acid permease [Acidobacteria bacterium]|nr:amino acid permease [Acidobacteriota bacterium]
MNSDEAGNSNHGLARVIGLGSATALVIGNVLGSAIFLTTGIMAERMPSPPLILLAWGVGGLMTIAGGLTCAELGAMYPRAGGWYTYLSEAYGPLWGFLYGWSGLLVMITGSVAAVAVGFAEYFSYFFPSLSTTRIVLSIPLPWGLFEVSRGQMVAAASILLLGGINYIGVRTGNAFQTMLTVVKVLALAGIVVAAFVLRPVRLRLTPVAAGLSSPLASFGLAMIAVQWAYIGWEYAAFAAGEIKRPARNLPLALMLGTVLLTLLYVSVNLAYFFALPVGQMRGVLRIAEQAMDALLPTGGATLVVLAVIVSTFGCNASSIIPMSRVGFAMAADGLLFRRAAAIHARYRTPHVAIVVTCGWSALLTMTGTYEQLYTYVVFTALLFYAAGGLAIFRLRQTRPATPRPYRCWGYPVTPLIFVISTLALVVSTLLERPVESLVGIAIVATGLPVYFRRKPDGC